MGFFDADNLKNGLAASYGGAIANKAVDLLRKATRFLQPGFTNYGKQYEPRNIPELKQFQKPELPSTPPSISIVVPSLNQADYLESSIKSLLDQGYPNLELIVVDGGSNDGCLEIIRKYSSRISWWCCVSDKGQVQALNKGFARSKGRIMGWLNADDMHLPYTLATVADFFESNPEIDVVYGHRILIDENGDEIGRWIMPPHENGILERTDAVPQETMFWRRRTWNIAGGRLDESYGFAMDWGLLLKFKDSGARMKRLPCFLGMFRIHGGQKSSPSRNRIGNEEMQRIRKRRLGYEPSRIGLILLTARYFLWARLFEVLWKAGLLEPRGGGGSG